MKSVHYPKITIVTPSYNQGKYLEKTILSVLSQNYPNLEYIVIDGGSNDESTSIINKYRRHLAYAISEPDNGQFDALNKGFKRSKGEVMGWLNSDDVLLPNSLHLVGKLFQQFPEVEWLTGQSINITSDDQLLNPGMHKGAIDFLIRWGFYHGKGLGFINQENTFWRRSLWERSGAFIDNAFYTLDYLLWKRFAEYASLVSVNAPFAAFRLNPDRKSAYLDNYHREIHPLLPLIPDKLSFIPKALHFFLLYRIAPNIIFDEKYNTWTLSKGRFFGTENREVIDE